jgi:hypothetical protein
MTQDALRVVRKMSNPFKYAGVVGKTAFCNRKQELSDLSRAMQNGDRLFLYSERRLGKTSLVKLALSNLPKKEYLWAYVDLWPTDGEASFASAIAKAITESLAGTADKMLAVAKSFFGRLTSTISTDSSGNPQIGFQRGGDASHLPELQEVLKAPAEIAKHKNRKVVLVLDEFQRILEYGSDQAERTLRSAIQDQENVSYIFLTQQETPNPENALGPKSPFVSGGWTLSSGAHRDGRMETFHSKPLHQNQQVHFAKSGAGVV